jgi:hypothetical protein
MFRNIYKKIEKNIHERKTIRDFIFNTVKKAIKRRKKVPLQLKNAA